MITNQKTAIEGKRTRIEQAELPDCATPEENAIGLKAYNDEFDLLRLEAIMYGAAKPRLLLNSSHTDRIDYIKKELSKTGGFITLKNNAELSDIKHII